MFTILFRVLSIIAFTDLIKSIGGSTTYPPSIILILVPIIFFCSHKGFLTFIVPLVPFLFRPDKYNQLVAQFSSKFLRKNFIEAKYENQIIMVTDLKTVSGRGGRVVKAAAS